MLVALLVGCGGPDWSGESCACPIGHGARSCQDGQCGECMCLPPEPVDADPAFTTTFFVAPDGDGDGSEADPWGECDWSAIDGAVASGDVRVAFGPGTYAVPIEVLRTDDGPFRVVLDGAGAVAPGVTTTEDDVKRSRVTVRGFELADTHAQGVYWRAGDDVVLEDLVVHDNGRSPGIMFDYASRSGLPSRGLVVRNNHLFDITGECVYIGGAEGGPDAAHSEITVANNLIHDCGDRLHVGNDWDGINIKDRDSSVVLRNNVVFHAHWGYQLDSPVEVQGGLIFDVKDEGVMMGGVWGDGFEGAVLSDVVVLRSGHSGVYIGADRADTLGIELRGVTVADAGEASITFAGGEGIRATLDDVLLTGGVAANGWGDVQIEGSCASDGAGEGAAADIDCEPIAPDYADLDSPAGPDGVFFTADDGWRDSRGLGAGP